MIGKSLLIEKLRQQISQYANAPFPVLIEGESGSGKELVAAALHRQSQPRRQTVPRALNCAAISPTLVEPTLFGYSKGSFTGATTSARAISKTPRTARCFSTKSASCRSNCRQNCCACSKTANISASAKPPPPGQHRSSRIPR